MQIYKLTHKQVTVAVGLLVVAACASMLLVIQTPKDITKSSPMWTTESIPVMQDNTLQAPEVNASMTKAEMPSVQIPVKHHAAAPVNQVAKLTSWEMGNVKAATPSIPLNEKITDYAIVQLEQNPALLPAVGEQIWLPMLGGQSVVANVESMTKNPNGDFTWSGHLQGHGTDYPVVMTYGEHSIFATITTPEGSYTMESIDGLGWLYKNPAEVELSNPGAKDFLDVPEVH